MNHIGHISIYTPMGVCDDYLFRFRTPQNISHSIIYTYSIQSRSPNLYLVQLKINYPEIETQSIYFGQKHCCPSPLATINLLLP